MNPFSNPENIRKPLGFLYPVRKDALGTNGLIYKTNEKMTIEINWNNDDDKTNSIPSTDDVIATYINSTSVMVMAFEQFHFKCQTLK